MPRTTTARIHRAEGESRSDGYSGAIIIAYVRRPLWAASPLLRNLPFELRSSVHLHRAGSPHEDGFAHQKAAVESVHFPLWTYNPATGKFKLDSAVCATLGSVGLRHHA